MPGSTTRVVDGLEAAHESEVKDGNALKQVITNSNHFSPNHYTVLAKNI